MTTALPAQIPVVDANLLVANLLDRAGLYRNDAPRCGCWLAVPGIVPDLRRDALGAPISLVLGDRALRAAAGLSWVGSISKRS